MKPLAIDLCCGLGGWTFGLLAEGYDVIGFDNERHVYGEHRYPAQLVVQDILTLHGSQLRTAALIVASPPCQFFSYTAMPWSRAKALAAEVRTDPVRLERELALFKACFRIQREACEAAGRHIPMVVENVKGAQPWVGRARWSYGSFYLWGDVPALMPPTKRIAKVGGLDWKPPDDPRHRPGQAFNTTAEAAIKNTGASWVNIAHNTESGCGQNPDGRKGIPHRPSGHWTNAAEHEGVKQHGSGAARFDKALDERRKNRDGVKVGGGWFETGNDQSPMRQHHSGSTKRKFASAMIAKIPEALSRHIAAVYYPRD